MVEPTVAVLGVDHHRTQLALRERMAVPNSELGDVLAAVAQLPGCTEAVCLSTCNRVEWYIAGTPSRDAVLSLMADRHGVDVGTLGAQAYWHERAACVRHLFRVVSSLESLVIGEYQIVHQVKRAYEEARLATSTGPLLNPLFQQALAVAKEVRNRTEIGRHKLSIASVAVDLARHIHGDLARARLLVVGAGEIAELAVRYLVDAGVRHLTLCNRSGERAQDMAGQHAATVVEWSALGQSIASHDIVVSSTAAPTTIITVEDVRRAMRGRRTPLMLIDLAVPRDVEPAVSQLADVYLYNIDSLESVIAANRQLRVEEVAAAAALVDGLARQYAEARGPGQGRLLAQVASFFEDIVAAEEARLSAKDPLERGDIRYGLERVAGKLQHPLLRYLREHPADPAVETVIREILGLDRG
jgi:glutamyl-tRNA reductase